MEMTEHLIRFAILILGIGFAVILGHFRPEWKSRKTVICWIWTIAAIDIIIIGGSFAVTLTAQMFIGGALVLNVINFIGDRIETIKFKDFSASLGQEDEYNREHSINKPRMKKEPKLEEPIEENSEIWPDGEKSDNPVPSPKMFKGKKADGPKGK